jgi:hypothetical protein
MKKPNGFYYGAIHKILDAAFANFFPSLPPSDCVWQLAVHPIIKHATLCQPRSPIQKKPKYSQNTNLTCNNRFKTLPAINRHYFNAILKLSLNSFPLRFSLVCWINGSAVFHSNVWRSILIENIDFSSKGHMFTSTVLFCYRQGYVFPLRLSVTWYHLW